MWLGTLGTGFFFSNSLSYFGRQLGCSALTLSCLAFIAYKSGLKQRYFMGRFLGEIGSKLSDFILVSLNWLVCIWGTATICHVYGQG